MTGLFAVAVLTAIANGIDVGGINFDQSGMRRHFIECIEAKLLTPFPFQVINCTHNAAILKSLPV